jgi:exopolysaccharide biosynthesis polyprenyl glycosylphosphotransferase
MASWITSLAASSSRSHHVIGSGTVEYARVVNATVLVFGLFAMVAFLFDFELGRGYLLTSLIAGLLLLPATRWHSRQWLRRLQGRGECLSRTLLVGDPLKSGHVASAIERSEGSGFLLLGAITPDGKVSESLVHELPVLGNYGDVSRVVDEKHIEVVVLTGADDISPSDMRRLGWDLDSRGVELIVAPALTDIAGPRIHSRPVAGLPLIHVSYPAFEGSRRLFKRTFDVILASLLIVAFLPLLAILAILIKRSGPGGVLYRQERIGHHGAPFGMLKFRSMVANADDQLMSLLDAQGSAGTPLFKVNDDPRITRVGRVLRRYSLDELPQLFNVLWGEMSLVGPRPQRAAEVAMYGTDEHRRLFMKPGMSGLWQVSGRSNLSWEDSIRLDLFYVENWSFMGDLHILWRTVRAVRRAEGAV